jgi:hypothetical protein
MAGDGHPRRDRRSSAQALDVRCDRGSRIDDRKATEIGFLGPNALGVLDAEAIVGEPCGAALCVLNDGDLEQRTLRTDQIGECAEVGDVVDYLSRHTSTVVAKHESVTEVEPEDVSRVDAGVEAGEDEQPQRRNESGALMLACFGEGSVAGDGNLDAREALAFRFRAWRGRSRFLSPSECGISSDLLDASDSTSGDLRHASDRR